MPYAIIVLALVLLSGCGGGSNGPIIKPPQPQPPDETYLLEWTKGLCQDNFILYQRLGDGWLKVSETTKSNIALPIEEGEEIEFTVAGVCKDGEHKGEWLAKDSLTVTR